MAFISDGVCIGLTLLKVCHKDKGEIPKDLDFTGS
jgi:hypothetical protein